MPSRAYGAVHLNETALLIDNLDVLAQPVASELPSFMEDYAQGCALILELCQIVLHCLMTVMLSLRLNVLPPSTPKTILPPPKDNPASTPQNKRLYASNNGDGHKLG